MVNHVLMCFYWDEVCQGGISGNRTKAVHNAIGLTCLQGSCEASNSNFESCNFHQRVSSLLSAGGSGLP